MQWRLKETGKSSSGPVYSWMSSYPGAMNAVVSKNDSVFVFTQRWRVKPHHVLIQNGKWEEPVDITQQLGGLDRLYTNSISGNGRILVLYINDGNDGTSISLKETVPSGPE